MKFTILLVMSDPVVRSVFQETLEHAGYTVVPSGDIGTAVDRIAEMEPDLLMIRSYIEGITGHDAAIYLRSKNPGMRVLITGGLLDDDRLLLREELKGFEIFPKPYPAGELIDKVKGVLAKPRG